MLTELYYIVPQPYNAKFIYRNMYTTELKRELQDSM